MRGSYCRRKGVRNGEVKENQGKTTYAKDAVVIEALRGDFLEGGRADSGNRNRHFGR